jgi:hypothetical protein
MPLVFPRMHSAYIVGQPILAAGRLSAGLFGVLTVANGARSRLELEIGLFGVLTLVDGAKRPAESRPAGRIACPTTNAE